MNKELLSCIKLDRGDLIVFGERPYVGALNITKDMTEYYASEGVNCLTIDLYSGPCTITNHIDEKSFIEYVHQTSTSDDVINMCKKIKKKKNIGLIVVNAFQLMVDCSNSKKEKIDEVARKIKQMAVDLNVPVILITFVGRIVEIREDHRPRLTDFYKYSNIVEEADVVILLNREYYYDTNVENRNLIEINVAKNKYGDLKQFIY